MKTLILFPRNRDITFNTSAAALAGVARHHGFECAAYPVADGMRIEDVAEHVLAQRPDLVCATFMTRDILGFRSLFAALRRRSNVFTAVGGYHATIRPRHVAQWTGIDAIGIGEGERPFLSLLRALSSGERPGTIRGLWASSGEGFVDPIPSADPEPDIAELPPWDYSVVDDPTFVGEEGKRFLVTRTSRACPFACTYCSVPLWESTNGLRSKQFVNVRPVAQLCRELSVLRERYAPTDIEFWDPQFPFANAWLEELAVRFPAEVGLPFRVLMHPKTLNPRRIERLAAAGCTQLWCGLESGDAGMRKDVLNKACSDDEIARTAVWLRDAGIQPCAFVMWNLPGETRAQAEKTIEMVDRVAFERVRINTYIPLPGTVLGDSSAVEFPDTVVDVFGPLAEWSEEKQENRSSMNEADYEQMARRFAELHDRYAERGGGSSEMAAERLRRLTALLGLQDPGAPRPPFRLTGGYCRPQALTLVLLGPDGTEQRLLLRPRTAENDFYACTEHCSISYEGHMLSESMGHAVAYIRERIEHVRFEEL